MHTGYALVPLLGILLNSVTAQYVIKSSFVGQDFFDGFTWFTSNDPTHGRVNYVDQATAQETNLSYASPTSFIMRADDFNTVPSSARGRDSVRITSNLAYGESIIVLDINHMPTGCTTWPAFWTLSQKGPWPAGGEIDIIEGVNTNTANLASLHTSPNCTVPQIREQVGSTVSTNCDANVNDNQGCGTSFNGDATYGSGFNAAQGGWYVMTRSSDDGISVYFWSRNDYNVPGSVKSGDLTIAVDDSWGEPQAYFPTDTCDYRSHFNAHQIIFDLTFCGDWAGTAYTTAGCGIGTCSDYVDNNPEAFSEAYWEVNSLRVYTPYG